MQRQLISLGVLLVVLFAVATARSFYERENFDERDGAREFLRRVRQDLDDEAYFKQRSHIR